MNVGLPVLLSLGAYLLGSIPVGYLLMKWGKGIDIRTVGSGNIGMTNVWRAAGWHWGVPVLCMDILKGYLGVSAPTWIIPSDPNLTSYQVLGGVLVMIGNIFPVFLNFKGGKGVGVGLGIFLTLLPLPTLFAFVAFGLTVLMTRMISAGSLAGVVTIAVSSFFTRVPADLFNAYAILAVIVVVWTHRSNIRRILAGTENRIGRTRAGKGKGSR